MRILHACLIALAACRGSAAAPAPSPAPADDPADGRKPVPMTARMAAHHKQEMRDHLRAVEEITAALAKDDLDAVAASAARIGWSEQQAAMCKHMGAGAPGFADLGEHFHRTADGIADAARRRDRAATVAALDATLRTCVGCHDAFREQVVDEASFATLAGSAGMDTSCPMMQGK